MQKNNKKSEVSKKGMVVAAAGAAALGAGAYYLLGPKAKAHQKKAKVLMAKIKKEVESEIKKAKVVGAPLYHKTVDFVSENYSKEYKAHEKEIKDFAKKLKSEWKNVSKIAKKSGKSSKKR